MNIGDIEIKVHKVMDHTMATEYSSTVTVLLSSYLSVQNIEKLLL